MKIEEKIGNKIDEAGGLTHIEKALALADKYEKKGNKQLSEKFFKIAEKYEERLKKKRGY